MRSPRDRLSTLTRPVRRAVLARRRLLAAVLAAIAAATGIQAATAPPPAARSVLVAARDLPAGTVLATADLTPAAYAVGSAPQHLAPAPVGRMLAAPLRRGEAVTDVRLVGPSLTEGHPELTAVPVRLPDAGMADLLEVGDRIDLVAADPQGSAAIAVADSVLVLALPPANDEVGASGLAGRLIVIGADESDVATIADAAVRYFLTYTFAR